MDSPVNTMRELVFQEMAAAEGRGELSKAHGPDHVENVGRYASKLAPWFGKRLGVAEPDRLAVYGGMAGLSHDVIRYASQVDAGEDSSAQWLDAQYGDHFSRAVPQDEYGRFVMDVVRTSNQSFSAVQDTYRDDPEALAVALAVAAADKLIEASGPRVLERRSYFVGKERMLNPQDLGAVFRHPDESMEGVLSETMVRLGHVNHVSHYGTDDTLRDLVEELHAPQYLWYRGMIMAMSKTEKEAFEEIHGRLAANEATQSLAARVEQGGRRLLDENHLEGQYLGHHGFPRLQHVVDCPPDDDDFADSSQYLVMTFATAPSPEEAIKAFERRPEGPPRFQHWMRDIAAYRQGGFGEHLMARLDE